MKTRFLSLLPAFLVTFTAPGADQVADMEERKALVGIWKGGVVGPDGNPDKGPVKLTMTITMHEISALQNGKTDMGAGTYTLNPSASPKQLDATRTRGSGPKGTFQGIYTVEGDTLKWCVAMPREKKRPTVFAGDKGFHLLILKRVKE